MSVHEHKIKNADGTEVVLQISDTGDHLEFIHFGYKAIIKVRRIDPAPKSIHKSRYDITPVSDTYHYSLRVYRPGASGYFVAIPDICDMFREGVRLIEQDYNDLRQ